MSETQPLDPQPIMILGQFIKDLSFEHPNPLASLSMSAEQQPNLNIDVAVNANALSETGTYEVILGVKVDAKVNDSIIFLMELDYAAIVKVEGIDQESLNPILMINIPHMLFPFVRAIMYNTIREGGLPPLMLNPIDFAAMYEANTKH